MTNNNRISLDEELLFIKSSDMKTAVILWIDMLIFFGQGTTSQGMAFKNIG